MCVSTKEYLEASALWIRNGAATLRTREKLHAADGGGGAGKEKGQSERDREKEKEQEARGGAPRARESFLRNAPARVSRDDEDVGVRGSPEQREIVHLMLPDRPRSGAIRFMQMTNPRISPSCRPPVRPSVRPCARQARASPAAQ